MTVNSISGNDNDILGQTGRAVCAAQASTREGAGVGSTLTPAGLNLTYSGAKAHANQCFVFHLELNSIQFTSIQFAAIEQLLLYAGT